MKILIVEDEPSLRELIQRSLEKERYVVEVAADFNSALCKIEDYDYDCVLLDIMLPDVDGFQILKQIREKYTFPVIMLTAKVSSMDKINGLTLGADVPYCVMRGTVLAEGIGEILTPLPACPKCHVLIAKPPISVSTKMVYEKLDALEITEHPDIDGILNGLARKNIHKVAECMGNVLEQVTIPVYPVIEQIKNVMKEGGAMNAMMSGSGPTVFGLFEDRQSARRAAQKIKEQKLAKQVYVTSIHQARRK